VSRGGSFLCENLTDFSRCTGEQSVGKSYSLNHLVDTSFAGSAMRTTGDEMAFRLLTFADSLLLQRVSGCR